MADLEHGIPNTPATIFEAGSVSKQFTAAAIQLLAMEGLLSLDDDVGEYVPELPDYGQRITIRQMMNHTSGLRDWGSVAEGTFAIDRPIEDVHGNGGLLTTVGDLLTWNRSLADGRLAGAEFLERMHTRGRLDNGREISYAAGLRIGLFKGVPSITHTGSTSGYGAFLGRYPDQALSVALLCNVSNVNPGDLGAQIASVYLGGAIESDSKPEAVTAVSLPAEELEAKAGLYRDTQTGKPMRLAFREGRLQMDDEHDLRALSATEFQIGTGDRRLVFEITAGSRPTIRAMSDGYEDGGYEPVEGFEPTAADLAEYQGEYHSQDADLTLVLRVENEQLTARRRPDQDLLLRPIYADAFEVEDLGLVRFYRDESGRVVELGINQARVYDLRFQRAGRSAPTYRVAVIRYSHETCTFCPGGDTDVERWTRGGEPLRGDEVLEAGGYIRGFARQAADYGDIELLGITSPVGVFGGSSRSWNTKNSFEHFMGLILADLESKLPVDGVYLALHGAMAVREVPRPEAEIARRVRQAIGSRVPIVGTFDLHGNEDGEFLEWADGAFVTKRYPHYDSSLQGQRAARYLRAVMRGDYVPATASRKPPVITATVLQWTGQSPSMDIMERARRWESRQPGAFVSVLYGYPWSDVPDVGATVHVMTNDDQELADQIADDMTEFIWRRREEFAQGEFPMPEEAVRQAREAIAVGATPVVLADYSDRPGDATWILRQLLEQEVTGVLYAALTDEAALKELAGRNASPGDPFDREVGGYTSEQAGEPVRITGTLRYLGSGGSYDQVAAIEFGDGNMLVLSPAYEQITSPEQLRFGPINPDDYDLFVVKSRVHFRRGFDETGYAKTIIVVEAPGPFVGTTRLDALPYEHAPIDRLYPFGTPEEW
jgi:microcystin degradation protein MlrC